MDLLPYWIKGFHLANKSLPVYITGVVFGLLSWLPVYIPETSVSWIISIFEIAIFFMSMAFAFSIPFFLYLKTQNKPLLPKLLWETIWQNTKRSFWPMILVILFCLAVFIICTVTSFYSLQRLPTEEEITNFFNQSPFNPYVLISMLLFSFLEYTGIYFSIEKQGVFRATKNSIIFGYKFFRWTAIISITYFIWYAINHYLPLSFDHPLRYGITTFIYPYTVLMVSAATLFFYLDQKNK